MRHRLNRIDAGSDISGGLGTDRTRALRVLKSERALQLPAAPARIATDGDRATVIRKLLLHPAYAGYAFYGDRLLVSVLVGFLDLQRSTIVVVLTVQGATGT